MGEIMLFPKPKRKEDPKILEMVRNQRCCACGAWPSDAHHVTTAGARGGDTGDNVMPLCRHHHQEWHAPFKGPSYMVDNYPGVGEWLYAHERTDVLIRIGRLGKGTHG